MNILSKYDLFIFDWDNTLCTTSPLLDTLHYLVRRLGYRSSKRFEINLKAEEREEKVSKIYAALYEVYSAFFKPTPNGNAIRLISYLKKHKKRVAIFSDGRKYRLLSETRRFGIARYADLILSANSINAYKPNPTGLVLTARRLRAKKSRSIYIGDMAIDVLTAKFAEMDSCAIASGISSWAMLKRQEPTYIFKNLKEFLAAAR